MISGASMLSAISGFIIGYFLLSIIHDIIIFFRSSSIGRANDL